MISRIVPPSSTKAMYEGRSDQPYVGPECGRGLLGRLVRPAPHENRWMDAFMPKGEPPSKVNSLRGASNSVPRELVRASSHLSSFPFLDFRTRADWLPGMCIIFSPVEIDSLLPSELRVVRTVGWYCPICDRYHERKSTADA